jgi:hypothetical protein
MSAPNTQKVAVGLARAALAGITPHTLAVAMARLSEVNRTLETEAMLGAALLSLARLPANAAEMAVFVAVPQPLTAITILDGLPDNHASHYVVWLTPFLTDAATPTAKNARALLQWLASNRTDILRANQPQLTPLRKLAQESEKHPDVAAYLAFALGACGTMDDYDVVIRLAEVVIEHDRERLGLVADGLYRLYPPALINALNFFLERADPSNKKQFLTGIKLLEKVAEIDDAQFWRTYADEMGSLIDQLAGPASRNQNLERLLDQIEKQLAYAHRDD